MILGGSMKSVLKFVLGWGAAVLVLAALTLAQTPNGIHGAFMGNIQLPAGYVFTFGNGVTAGDVSIGKNGTNVLGITGNLGGSGSTANTTTTPAGPFAWGTVAMSSNTATVTFKTPFTNTPACFANDVSGVFAVKAAPTATTVVLTNTGGGATDTVAYGCFGNAN
jgi:hypothetical protein